MATSGEKHSPLEQFEIIPFLNFKTENFDLSVTNSSIAMLLTVTIIALFFSITVSTRAIIPSRLQLISEMCYNFITQLIKDGKISSELITRVLEQLPGSELLGPLLKELPKIRGADFEKNSG